MPSIPDFQDEITPPAREDFQEELATQQAALRKMIEVYITHTFLDPLKTEPADTQLRTQFARTCVGIQELDRALHEYQRLIEMDRNEAGHFNNIGNVYFLKGAIEEALKSYEQAAELEPDNEEIRSNIDIALRALDKGGVVRKAPEIGPLGKDRTKADEAGMDEDRLYWAE